MVQCKGSKSIRTTLHKRPSILFIHRLPQIIFLHLQIDIGERGNTLCLRCQVSQHSAIYQIDTYKWNHYCSFKYQYNNMSLETALSANGDKVTSAHL